MFKKPIDKDKEENKNSLCDKDGVEKDDKDDKFQKPGPEEPASTRVERGERDLLEELKRQKEEYLNGWKRERADFLNYKKDEMERMGQLIKYANEELILKILPILDNFDIAARQNFPSENLSGQEKNNQTIQGFLQIRQQFRDFLRSQGIEEIKAVGDPPSHKASDGQGPPSPKATARQRKFDPNFMETVGEVEVEGTEPGIVVEEIQKGYTMYGRIIRPAKVKVTK